MRLRLGERLTAHPLASIAFVAVMTVLLAWPVLTLEIKEGFGDYWNPDDPDLMRLEQTLEQFDLEIEGGGVVAIAFEDEVFTRANLMRIEAWTRALDQVPSVSKVYSLTNIPTIRSSVEGIDVAQLIPDRIPRSAEALAALEARAREDSDIAGRLLSADGRATGIFVASAPGLSYAEQLAVGDALHAFAIRVENEEPGLSVHVTGSPAFLSVFHHLTRHEMVTLYPIVVLCMTAILWASFRDRRAVLVPLAVMGIASIWTMGFLALSGRFLNSTTVAIPAVVVVISLADTIHIINQYFETVRRAGPEVELTDRKALMGATLDRIMLPCFLTTLTTAVGFLSLFLVDVPLIQDIGLFSGFGVAAAFVVSMILVPACYMLGPLPSPRATDVQVSGWVGRFLDRVTGLVLERPRTIAVVSIVALLGLGVGGVSQLRVDSQWKEFVKESHRIREAIRFVDEHLGGYDWASVVLELPDDATGDFLDPERLAVVARIHEAAEREAFVGSVSSIVTPLRLANQIFHAGDPEARDLPTERPLAAQYLLLYEFGGPEIIDAVLSFDRRQTLITARLMSPGDLQLREWMARFEPWMERTARDANMTASLTGFAPIMSSLNHTISVGLAESLLAAVFLIAVVMSLALRNVRLGLVSMIPNGIPVLTTLGFMGWLDIPLSGQTAMIGAVSIGLAVDDTIHFLHRFQDELERNGGDHRRAAAMTIHSTGRAIVFTSLVLFAGFATFIFSAFVQFTDFGLLTAMTMLTAVLGDLLLLPVLLIAFPGLTAARQVKEAAAS